MFVQGESINIKNIEPCFVKFIDENNLLENIMYMHNRSFSKIISKRWPPFFRTYFCSSFVKLSITLRSIYSGVSATSRRFLLMPG